jgi:pyridoxine 5-phosphate synthase
MSAMTKLSVNINKIALIRNSRIGNNPNVLEMALLAEKFGANGITVHPRPDERHIRYADIPLLKYSVQTEFNIEGNPMEAKFIELVLANPPHQVTLVPDHQNQLTSDHGWDTIQHQHFLAETIQLFQSKGIRTSVFVDPEIKHIEGAKKAGADRIELYTEAYASGFNTHRANAIAPYLKAAQFATEIGLGINAGHDLNLENLSYLKAGIPQLMEVSIGHALVCDALLFGWENAIQQYKRALL